MAATLPSSPSSLGSGLESSPFRSRSQSVLSGGSRSESRPRSRSTSASPTRLTFDSSLDAAAPPLDQQTPTDPPDSTPPSPVSSASNFDGAPPPLAAAPCKPRGREPISPDFRLTHTLRSHRGPVSQVRISPNGRWIASSSADGTLKLWDAATGNLTDTLVGHMAGVNCLAWSPDSETIASGSDDKAIRLWDRVTGRPKTSAKSGGGGGGPPIGVDVGIGIGITIATATSLKEAAGPRGLGPMPPLLGHHSYVHAVAFSPKGNVLASGSYDEAVFLWDVRSGRLMRSLPAHSDPVSGLDFCQDGTLVVSCSTDGLIRIWDAMTGQCLRTLVHEDNPAVTNVCFAPSGNFVLAFSLDSCIRLWDYVSGSVKKTYQGHQNARFAVGGCFGIWESGVFVVSPSEDGRLVVWDVTTKQLIQSLDAHDGVCFWVDTHHGTMVSAGQDKTVKMYRSSLLGSDPVKYEDEPPPAPNNGAGQVDGVLVKQEDSEMGGT